MPVISNPNGVHALYTLRYAGVEFQTTERTIEISYTSSVSETVSLTGLEANTVYGISVSVSTMHGEGPLTTIQIRTSETGIYTKVCVYLSRLFNLFAYL